MLSYPCAVKLMQLVLAAAGVRSDVLLISLMYQSP